MASLPQIPKVHRSIFAGAVLGVALLVSQNLMGMYMNFWVDLSIFSPIIKAFTSEFVLDAHVAVGVVIVSGTFSQVVLANRSGNRIQRIPAISAFTFSLVAFLSGVEFTFGGGDDIFSFTMELGFVGVFASVATILYLSGKTRGAFTRN